MSFLSRGYAALVGDAATPQSGAEIVDKLCDRVVNATLLEDRRAAILGLKGLSRQYQLVSLQWKANLRKLGLQAFLSFFMCFTKVKLTLK